MFVGAVFALPARLDLARWKDRLRVVAGLVDDSQLLTGELGEPVELLVGLQERLGDVSESGSLVPRAQQPHVGDGCRTQQDDCHEVCAYVVVVPRRTPVSVWPLKESPPIEVPMSVLPRGIPGPADTKAMTCRRTRGPRTDPPMMRECIDFSTDH
jgi:hypothetical protein